MLWIIIILFALSNVILTSEWHIYITFPETTHIHSCWYVGAVKTFKYLPVYIFPIYLLEKNNQTGTHCPVKKQPFNTSVKWKNVCDDEAFLLLVFSIFSISIIVFPERSWSFFTWESTGGRESLRQHLAAFSGIAL